MIQIVALVMGSAPYKKIYTIEHEGRIDVEIRNLEKLRDKHIQNIHSLQGQVFKLNQEIADIKEKKVNQTLTVSAHAIDRFKERIVLMPEKSIRKMLSSPELNNAYLKQGPGKYEIKEAPGALIVIKDFTVVTVINKNDWFEKFKILELYMDYYIEQKVDQALGVEVFIRTFAQYRKLYYKTNILRA